MHKMFMRSSAFLAIGVFALVGSPRAQALVITPTFDSTITSDANASTIEASINQVIQLYQNTFTNNITVNITFQETTSGLGASSTFQQQTTYKNLINKFNALIGADPTETKFLQQAVTLGHLVAQNVDPVNGNGNVLISTANARAIGILTAGGTDSTISLNTSIMNLSRTGTIDPSKYDLMSVTMHEINEALGLYSALDGLASGAASPTGPFGIMDLYRYDANGNRVLSTNASTASYFSIDGTTRYEQFNQSGSGDFHDWASGFVSSAQVQDATGTPGTAPNLGSGEINALLASGYTSALVPEPTSWILLGVGLPLAVLVMKRRRVSQVS